VTLLSAISYSYLQLDVNHYSVIFLSVILPNAEAPAIGIRINVEGRHFGTLWGIDINFRILWTIIEKKEMV
jgi:hypothetical protein